MFYYWEDEFKQLNRFLIVSFATRLICNHNVHIY